MKKKETHTRVGARRMNGLTRRQAKSVLAYLKEKGVLQNTLLWALGITTGLRISDLLSLRVRDLLDVDGNIADTIEIKESKTQKLRTMALMKIAQDAFRDYLEKTKPDENDWLFSSRRTAGPITRQQAHHLVKEWCEACNLRGYFGTHTLRKTFATAAYEATGHDPVATARITGHSNPSQLLNYIGKSARAEEEALGKMDEAFRL